MAGTVLAHCRKAPLLRIGSAVEIQFFGHLFAAVLGLSSLLATAMAGFEFAKEGQSEARRLDCVTV